MKMKKLRIITALIMAVSVVRSAPFTWDGGGSDNKWQTPANWNPDGAPDSDGTAVLTFSGNTRNGTDNDFAGGTAFTALNFINDGSSGMSSAFTLAGAPLTLGGNITTTASSATIRDYVTLDVTLSASSVIRANTTHDLEITGAIGESGGSQGLTKTGSGNLYLKGANSYSGKTIIDGGVLYFTSIANIGGGASALGSPTTLANGTIDFGSKMCYYGGAAASSDRPLRLTELNTEIRNDGGLLTLSGDIISANNNSRLVCRGFKDIRLTGFISLGSGYVSRTDNGVLVLDCPTNSFAGNLGISAGTISVATIADSNVVSPIGNGSGISFGQRDWTTTGTLKFNGASGGSCNRNMTVYSSSGEYGAVIENTVAGQLLNLSGNFIDGGKQPPPLWLDGAGDGEVSGVIQGGIKVIKRGSGTWALSGSNTTTGTVSIADGTLMVNGSTTSGSAISVGGAGTLGGMGTVHGVVNLDTGATLSPGVDGVGTLTLANGGSDNLTLNGNTINCDLSDTVGVSDLIAVAGTLVLNGVNTINVNMPDGPAPYGTYTVMTYAAKSGSGTMVVDAGDADMLVTVGATAVTLKFVNTSTVTWQGDGTANAWDTSTENWTEGIYADGNVVIFDDTGSDSPAIDISPDAVEPFSVTVASDVNNYTIGGAAISGPASLVKSGTSTLTLTGANTYSGLTKVAGGTLALSGGSLSNSSINVELGATLTQDANSVIAGSAVNLGIFGSATLAGSNSYEGVTTVGVDGTRGCYLLLRNDKALGASTEGITLYGGGSGYNDENQVRMDVDGMVIKDQTLTFAGSGWRAGLHYSASVGSATWAGNIVLGGADPYLNARSSGCTLIIGDSSENTITGTYGILHLRGNGEIVINSTVAIDNWEFVRDNTGSVIINSTNNVWGNTRVVEGTLKLGANDALPTTTTLNIGRTDSNPSAKSTFDLNGRSQRIAALGDQHAAVDGGTQRIIGMAPSTLIVSNNAANTFGKARSSIDEEVTLVKSGTGTLTLTSTNTTAGSFIVSNGTLVVSSTGSFGDNSTNVVVAAGTLSLQSSVAIADSATLSIADGATLNLDAGVNESVAYLMLDGSSKQPNTYGATGSGATVIDNTHFSGSGILTVVKGSSGLLIILK